MALQDHLKIASTEIMKAADLLRQEINDLRNEESNLQQHLTKDIARLTAQLQMREQEVRSANDSTLISRAQNELSNLSRQMSEVKSQIGRDQKRIQDLIREKESLAATFDQQAKAISL